jgi:hypothetical protein
MLHGNAETIAIHGRHGLAEVVTVIRPALADVILPLMDHFMGQRAVHFSSRLIGK